MTELYTVRMKRKQIVTIYKGRDRFEETRLIDQVYTDLPYQTALSYQTKFPDAEVKIERQDPGYEPRSRAKHKVVTSGVADYVRPRNASAKPAVEREKPPAEAPTYDYAALVNKMTKEAVE